MGISEQLIHQTKKKKPQIQIQMSKLDKISGVIWEITFHGIMILQGRNSMFRWTIVKNIFTMWSFRDIKTSLDVLQQATIGDYWNIDGDKSLSEPWIGVDKCRIAQQRSTRRTHVDSRQTELETVYCKIWICCLENGHEKLSVQSHTEIGRRKNQNWTQQQREHRDIHKIPSDDSDNDEQRKKKSGNIKNLSDQRCVAKSPHQPTRTVQAGRDFVASGLSEIETKRLNSSCSKQDLESVIVESQRSHKELRRKFIRNTSRTKVTFPCRTSIWCTNRFPCRQQ